MSIITLNTRSLPDSAVTTAKVAADAITDAKIADDVVGTEHLTAGEVDATALGADSVTAAKINNDIISGSTELSAEPADTDEFLVSDAGTLKRLDYSLIKASPAMELLASADADNSATKVSFDGYFSSTYKNYKLIGSNITIASGQSALRVRFRRSNSEVSTSNYYAVGVRYYIVDGSITAVGQTGQSSGLLVNENTARTDGYNSSFTLDLYDPLGTNNYKNATFICTGFDTGTNDNRHHFETGALGLTDSTSALSGITIDQAGGVNITRGNFKLYGIK